MWAYLSEFVLFGSAVKYKTLYWKEYVRRAQQIYSN
jgi:hypothetical protein